jgi:hypothetical protein
MRLSILFAIALVLPATAQETVPGPTSSNEFHDEQSGISLKLPASWSAQGPSHWGDRQTTVRFAGLPAGTFAALYFQVLQDQKTPEEINKALLAAVEAKQVQRRQEGLNNFTVRAGSCAARVVSGHSALSCVADFDEDGRAMTEYLTWVRTERLDVLFFGRTPAIDLDAFRKGIDGMIRTVSIP